MTMLFAQLYHAHHNCHNEDLPFWLELARQQGAPILELGCGTGRVLLSLIRNGLTTFGLDHDVDMLAVLQEQAGSELAPRCPIFLADMGAFRLARQFTLILLPCNTLSTLPLLTRRATLAQVRAHLSPQGLFAASLPNPALLARLAGQAGSEVEDIFPHPIDGEPVQVSSAWLRSERTFTISWYYDHLLPDGRVERFITQVSHELLSVESYFDALHQAGLQIQATFGDFDGSAFTQESPNLIFLAKASS
jgi:SAM-dependent methyltransferase